MCDATDDPPAEFYDADYLCVDDPPADPGDDGDDSGDDSGDDTTPPDGDGGRPPYVPLDPVPIGPSGPGF